MYRLTYMYILLIEDNARMMQIRMRHKSPHFWFAAGSHSNLAKTKLKNGLALVTKAIYLVNVSVVCGTLYSQ